MSTPPSLNFDRAVYAGDAPAPDSCAFCRRELPGEYFRVAGRLACDPCARQAASLVPPDTHRAYTHALLYGIGAAIVGCIAYAAFEIVTGIMLAWIAIGVGYLVGWAMKKGSGGIGGRRYQITAALLTYAAVAVAFVPVAMHESRDKNNGAQQTQTQRSEANDAQKAESRSAKTSGESKPVTVLGFLGTIAMLLAIGLISPVILLTASLAQGALNLVIIFIGIRYAWMATKSPRIPVEGPFTSVTPST